MALPFLFLHMQQMSIKVHTYTNSEVALSLPCSVIVKRTDVLE